MDLRFALHFLGQILKIAKSIAFTTVVLSYSSFLLATTASPSKETCFPITKAIDNYPEQFHLLQVGDQIFLVIDSGVIIPSFVDLLTGNAKLTCDYVFSSLTGQDVSLLSLQHTLIDLSTEQQLSNALDQLCPALYSALPLLELQNNVHMASVMTQKNRDFLCDCYCQNDERKSGFPLASYWIEPLGFYYNQKGVQEQFGLRDYTYGTAFGFIMPIDGQLFANVGLGYTHSNLEWNNNYGHANSSTIYLTPMLGYYNKNIFFSFLIQGDVDFYKVKRNVSFPGVEEQTSHQHKSYNLLCGLDFSMKLSVPHTDSFRYSFLYSEQEHTTNYNKADFEFYIQPEVQFYYMNFYQGSFVEEGGGSINLSVNRKRSVFLQPNLGLKFIQEINTENFCFAPNFYLGYLTNICLSDARYTSSLYELDIPLPHFYVNGFDRAVNQVVMGAEFVMRKNNRFLFTLGYNATMLSHMFTQGVNFRLSFEF